MNFFKKIKDNYHLKLTQELINEKKYDELDQLLLKVLKKDFSSFQIIFDKYKSDFLTLPKNKIYKNNIIWINSFLKKDNLILSNFIEFYFQKIFFDNYQKKDYYDEILEFNSKLNIKNMNFDFLIKNSYFYQYNIINYTHNSSIKFLLNQIPFFETKDRLMFSHPNLTKGYFYIIRDPLEVLTLINKEYNDIDTSIGELLNLDQHNKIISDKDRDFKISIPFKDWSTNVESWTGENILENFNGHIVNINKLQEDPFSEFTNIIGHLIQSGLNLELDYKLISEYCEKFNMDNAYAEKTNVSNQKSKLIVRQLIKTAEKFGYSI